MVDTCHVNYIAIDSRDAFSWSHIGSVLIRDFRISDISFLVSDVNSIVWNAIENFDQSEQQRPKPIASPAGKTRGEDGLAQRRSKARKVTRGQHIAAVKPSKVLANTSGEKETPPALSMTCAAHKMRPTVQGKTWEKPQILRPGTDTSRNTCPVDPLSTGPRPAIQLSPAVLCLLGDVSENMTFRRCIRCIQFPATSVPEKTGANPDDSPSRPDTVHSSTVWNNGAHSLGSPAVSCEREELSFSPPPSGTNEMERWRLHMYQPPQWTHPPVAVHPTCSKIIALPAPVGGCLVLGNSVVVTFHHQNCYPPSQHSVVQAQNLKLERIDCIAHAFQQRCDRRCSVPNLRVFVSDQSGQILQLIIKISWLPHVIAALRPASSNGASLKSSLTCERDDVRGPGPTASSKLSRSCDQSLGDCARRAVASDLVIDPLGTIPRAVAIVPLAGHRLFIASLTGDSRLVKLPGRAISKNSDTVDHGAFVTAINSETSGPGGEHPLQGKMGDDGDSSNDSMRIIQRFPSTGPFLDLCVANFNQRGQPLIVAACGLDQDGGLRLIRPGRSIQIAAEARHRGVRRLFALRGSFYSPDCDYLIESSFRGTRALMVTPDILHLPATASYSGTCGEPQRWDLVDFSPNGFDLMSPTLLASNVFPGDQVLQVTKTHVLLLEPVKLTLLAKWNVFKGGFTTIDFASASSCLLLVASGDGRMAVLRLQSSAIKLLQVMQLDNDISAISVHSSGAYAAVAAMSQCTLHLFQLPELRPLLSHPVSVSSQQQDSFDTDGLTVCSVAVVTMGGADHFVAGLGNGRIVTFGVVAVAANEDRRNENDDDDNYYHQPSRASGDVLSPTSRGFSCKGGPPTRITKLAESTTTRKHEVLSTKVSDVLQTCNVSLGQSPLLALVDRQVLSIGSRPVELCILNDSIRKENVGDQNKSEPAIPTRCIFVCCDSSFVITSSISGNLHLSDVVSSCISAVAAFPCYRLGLSTTSLATSDGKSLTIGALDVQKKLHVRTVPFKRSVFSIVFHESSGLFICGCPYELRCNDLLPAGFLLVDPMSMLVKAEVSLDGRARLVSSLSCVRFGKNQIEYIAIGVSDLELWPDSPTNGAICLYTINGGTNTATLVARAQTKGAVQHVQAYKDYLICSVGNRVIIFRVWAESGGLDEYGRHKPQGNNSDARTILRSTCQWPSNVAARLRGNRNIPVRLKIMQLAQLSHCAWITDLTVSGDHVVVGDLGMSIAILQYNVQDQTLKEICRDMRYINVLAVGALSQTVFIVADHDGRLFALEMNSTAKRLKTRATLKPIAQFYSGQNVNRIISGSLLPETHKAHPSSVPSLRTLYHDAVTAQVTWTSTQGSLGCILSLKTKALFLRLATIQKAMANVVNFADLSHDKYRKISWPATAPETTEINGFIDGNLVEYFLELPKNVQLDVFNYLRQIESSSGMPFTTLPDLVSEIEDLSNLR
eukprot:GHVT01090817.1.p1 GENE.GHVT01090817.1~~GHVT01090817.1.p1  ORF type:complete len:1454 (+),score=73.86 GHVT01090817.1:228-4589(+)